MVRAKLPSLGAESAQTMNHLPPPGSGDLRREAGLGSRKVGSSQKQKLVEASGRVSAGHSCPVAPLSPTPDRAPAGKTQGSRFYKYSAIIQVIIMYSTPFTSSLCRPTRRSSLKVTLSHTLNFC